LVDGNQSQTVLSPDGNQVTQYTTGTMGKRVLAFNLV